MKKQDTEDEVFFNELINTLESSDTKGVEEDCNLFSERISLSDAELDFLFKIYNEKHKHNLILRIWYFIISFVVLLTVIIVFATVALIAACKETINIEGAISICVSCSTVLSSIIVLPKLIGKNLFPEKEKDDIKDIINLLINNESGEIKNSTSVSREQKE